MTMKKLLAASLVALLSNGCQSNPPSAKSSAAIEITPITGSARMVELPMVRGGPAAGRKSSFVPVALFPGPAQPVGVAVSGQGRIFLSFPRWADPVKSTVVELRGEKLLAFPGESVNAFDGTDPQRYDPAEHLVSVQAIVFDARDRLWLLDPGGLNFAPWLPRGPKLWAFDINTAQRVKSITFPADVVLKSTSLNDIRIDLGRGAEGTAYITDSGAGGIIVVDLASGSSWRHLDTSPTVLPDPLIKAITEGAPFLQRKANKEVDSPDFRADGIALSPDGKTLYYTPVISHVIYGIPTDLLADRAAREENLNAAVKAVATKPSGNDGMICDGQGRIYTTDFEDNCIRRIDPATGTVEVIAQDERLIWPDTLAFHANELYVTVNQLARQPNYHFGEDQRKPPYSLLRLRVDGSAKSGGAR